MEKEKAVLTPKDPEFLPVQFDLTEARMTELAKEYDPKLIPVNIEMGDESYLEVHAKVMDIVKIRTGADKVRKELKADSLAWGKKVDAYSKTLTEKLIELERPWRKVKVDLEEAEKTAAANKLAAEQKRQAEIEAAIAGIRSMAEGLIGANAVTIQARIDELALVVVTEDKFGEFVEAAKVTGDIVMKSLTAALDERVEFEGQQAVLAEQQADLAEEQEKLAAGRKELADAQAAQEASERAVEAAKEKADKDAADEQRVKDEAAAQAEADKKVIAENLAAAKKNKAYMKKRLPQDDVVLAFVEVLRRTSEAYPPVKDPYLSDAVAEVVAQVESTCRYLEGRCQGGAPS